MDFASDTVILPSFVSTFGAWSTVDVAATLITTTIASYNWPAQEQAVYVPMRIPVDYPVARCFIANGSSAGGNWDFGIYTPGGGLVFQIAAETIGSGASQLQYFDNADFILPSGDYYFAASNDSATITNRVTGLSLITTGEGRGCGLLQEALGAGNRLKATATFAQWASTGLPLMGVTRKPSGF